MTSEAETIDSLILDLLEWIADRDRTYAETLDAWRTSCPRLPVWEDASDRGLVTTEYNAGQALVRLTPAGRSVLERSRAK
jgi:hypothetical protein